MPTASHRKSYETPGRPCWDAWTCSPASQQAFDARFMKPQSFRRLAPHDVFLITPLKSETSYANDLLNVRLNNRLICACGHTNDRWHFKKEDSGRDS